MWSDQNRKERVNVVTVAFIPRQQWEVEFFDGRMSLILINCVFWVKREENGDIAIRDGRGGYEQVARDHSRRQDNLSSRSR